MRLNAEFQRNLWQEVTLNRLIVAPLILGGLFFLVSLQDDPAKPLVATTVWAFVILTVLWGTVLAESSLASEISGRTWTAQRLTSMPPWSMTWGKVFGSTALAWYCGIIALAVMLGVAAFHPDQRYIESLPAGGVAETVLMLVALAVLGQCIGLISGFAWLQEEQTKSRRRTGLGMVLSLIITVAVMILFVQGADMQHDVIWYGRDYPAVPFYLVSLYIYSGWVLVGAVMQMRRELQVPNHPGVWLAFLVFLIGYIAGLFNPEDETSMGPQGYMAGRFLSALAVAVVWTYISLFWERTRGTDVRRLMYLFESGLHRKMAYEFPRWALSGILAVLIGIALMLYFPAVRQPPPASSHSLHGLTGGILFFMIRDVGLFMFFSFSGKPSRAGLSTIITLLVVYVLAPSIFNAMDADALLPVFWPNGGYHPLHSILPPLVEAAAIWYFTLRRWRRRFAVPATG